RGSQGALAEGRLRLRQAEKRVDRRTDEQLEGDQDRHRIARKVEDEVVAPDPEGNRLPRLDRNSPEDLLDSQARLRLAHEIVRADRGAAGRDEHVEAEQRALHRTLELVCVVADDPELCGDRAGQLERGGEQEAVRLVDLSRPELRARLLQLRAGDEDPDARSLRALHLVYPGGRERADLGRAEAHPGLENRVARAHIASALPNVRAGSHRFPDLDRIARILDELEWDDRVRPFRDGATGRDRHRLARLERALGRRSGRDSRDDGKARAYAGIPGTDGKAV